MDNNVILASFGASNLIRTRSAYQYDYGMILQFQGIELPTAYEVHFSNIDTGNAVTQIGNEDGVTIPDTMFLSGESINAWVYLHTGEDDGETVYTAVIPVLERAKPHNGTPTPVQQDAITEAIAALDSAVEQVEADASSANADALKAEGYAVGTQDGEDVESGSPYYHRNALWLEQQCGQFANRAEANANTAEAWAVGTVGGNPVTPAYEQYENNSKYYSQQAYDAKTASVNAQGLAEQARDDASRYAGDAYDFATVAGDKANDASSYADSASGYATNAYNFARTASGYATNAGLSASHAYGYATDASGSADRAEGAADNAQASADSVLGLQAEATVDSSVGTPSVTVTVSTVGDHKLMHFDFSNLKGDMGNVYFATFEIDPDTGELTMSTDLGYSGANFIINEYGYMEVSI